MLHSRLTWHIFLWLTVSIVFLVKVNAQKAYPIEIRHFDEEKVRKIQQDPQFDYTQEAIETYSPQDRDWHWKRWQVMQKDSSLQNKNLKKYRPKRLQNEELQSKEIWVYIGIATLLVLFLLMLTGLDLKSWLTRNTNFTAYVKTNEGISRQNSLQTIEASLQKAIQEEKYSVALCYAYLKAVYLLYEKNYLEGSLLKTNQEYQNELIRKKAPFVKEFKEIADIFAYIRYGGFEVSQEQFTILFSRFEKFYCKI